MFHEGAAALGSRLRLSCRLQWLALLALLLSVAAGPRDRVQITRITPRTGAWLPAPQRFPVTVEVHYASAAAAHLVVGAWRGGQQMVAPQVRALTAGEGDLVVTLAALDITPAHFADDNVRVRVSLQDDQGHEMSFAQSINPIGGHLTLDARAVDPMRDDVCLMQIAPALGTSLSVPTWVDFTLRIYYSVANSDYGFLDVLMAEGGGTDCWYAATVAIPRGLGFLRLSLPHVRLDGHLVGRKMAVVLPMRTQPLGGAVTTPTFGVYRLAP